MVVMVVLCSSFISDVDKKELEECRIDEVYVKKTLPYGSLGEDGRAIDCIYVKGTIDNGRYDVSISDGKGDLYNVNGTDYYITFTSFHGYAGYAEEGILDINGYNAYFYKKK